MNRVTAIYLIIVVFSLVLASVAPSQRKGKVEFTISYLGKAQLSPSSDTDTDQPPAQLPFEYNFSSSELEGDFEISVEPSVSSGYYSCAQTLFLNSDFNLWYTLDGSLPEANSTYSYLYDPSQGIEVDETCCILIRAEQNGSYSDVYYLSYVILTPRTDYIYSYGYNSLNSDDKRLYEFLYDNISEFKETIYLPIDNVSFKRVYSIMRCINYDNPLLFHIPLAFSNWTGSHSDVDSVCFNYDFDEQECISNTEQVIKAADYILKQADGAESLFDYLLSIHDSVLKNCSYDYSMEEYGTYEAFGVLVYQTGVCESYSRAFQYLCQRIGVENLLVVGTDTEEPHMWNMVMLDGEWYHSDLTWDDGEGTAVWYEYFLFNDDYLSYFLEREISPFVDTWNNYNISDIYNNSNYYPIPQAYGFKYSNYNY